MNQLALNWNSLAGWPLLLAVIGWSAAALCATHAILNKRDPRAAVYWVGLIFLVPFVGVFFYLLFGINRVRRRANLLRQSLTHPVLLPSHPENPAQVLRSLLPQDLQHLSVLATHPPPHGERPLVPGNRIDLLQNGDQAFPAMIDAIHHAQHSVSLTTYIFDRDPAGLQFADALAHAVQRGVEVRVLVDATGARYSFPTIFSEFRARNIPYARFLPVLGPVGPVTLNLRSHRKILVVDGRIGFTGGMNIRIGNCLAQNPSHPVSDLHFRVSGPLVAHLQDVFAGDWQFTTREHLHGPLWFPKLTPTGQTLARGIDDGPDDDMDQLRWTLLSALAAARRTVRVVTPYFIPDAPMITALNLAARRGVRVDVLLPAQGNLPFVQWASVAHWWQILERGCRIWLTPPPFDHSKLLVVDDAWALIGSSNWDPRSLRLNFEFNVEAFDPALGQQLAALIESKRARAKEVTLAEVDGRSLPIKLRDGIARLFSPLL